MPTINQLNAISQLQSSDLLPIYSSNDGDARKISAYNFALYVQSVTTTADSMVTQYSAPSATAFTATVTASSNSVWLILTPTAGFAAGAIVLPPKASAIDRQEVLVNCTQVVTALTITSAGATVTGAPTAFTANGFFRLRYDIITSTWYRVG